MTTRSVLTPEEKEHFVTHGWVKIPGAFTKEKAESVTSDVWTRLGMSPTDKSTWTRQRTNMPDHTTFDAKEFAPRAWDAICELVGGEDKISPESRYWRDSLIVNLGTPEGENKPVPPHQLDNWHVDGDFFVHYLDSAEQGLLVIPLFTDICPEGGGTMICPEAIPKIARYLHDHPEGVSPRFTPRGRPEFTKEKDLAYFCGVAKSSSHFVEAHGKQGDVYLLHPLMLHSATSNAKRNIRIITNPPISLKDNFNFNRPDGNYTLVEKATLRALGVDNLPDWKITTQRERIVPARLKAQSVMKLEELRRLEEKRMQEAKNAQPSSTPSQVSAQA